MKRVLSIQDLSCVGKCSLTVTLPVLSAMGCTCTPLPTALLSSHTAFPSPHVRILTEDMEKSCAHWKKIGAAFDVISVGYLADPRQAETVAQILEAFPSLTVIDPVMGDHGKLYSGITSAHVDSMKALCSRADVILPNVTEAALLTGIPYREQTDKACCKELLDGLRQLGVKKAIISGIAAAPDKIGFIGFDEAGDFFYETERVARQSHGTGDLFATVITGSLAMGRCLKDGAVLAARFVEAVLSETREATPFGVEFEKKLPWLWENM